MENVITINNVTLIIALMGTAFGVYHFFRNPDIKADKIMAIFNEKFKNHQDISKQLKSIEQNHLHTIEENIKDNSNAIRGIEKEVVKLGVILEERLPKK